jgi:site-specific recombinase XerD
MPFLAVQTQNRKEMASMSKRFRPHSKTLQPLQSGPLGAYLEKFAALLVQQGYSSEAGWKKVRLVADLSRWMVQKNLPLGELDEQRTTAFLGWRWKRVPRRSGDQCTLAVLLRQLRQADIVPPPKAPALTPIDLIERDYGRFLRQERGFMSASVGQYLPVARRFLWRCFRDGKIRLKELCTKDVTDFVLQDSSTRGRRSAQFMTTVLRSFLNYLFQEGRTASNLAMAIPAVAGWRLSELPRYLEAAQVEKLLRCCDRRRKVGRRDYAILLLLARLGLRAGEVAGLELDDIDWTAGELLIRGKGNRVDRLPLLHDVGRAVADYLRKGRPSCSTRRVFVHCKAPYTGFGSPPNTVCGIVRRALARAGLHPRHQGAHLLRHSLATNLLRRGASLAQIGQVLRHQQTQTTEIYAKVDLNALRALAQPWPGGVR